jgi:hypothetical protein
MPDQLFTYYIENPLIIISINSGSWAGVMVVWLEIETWIIGKGGPKREGRKGVGKWGKRYGCFRVLWPLCVFGCICFCSGGCLCQGLEGAGSVYGWYSMLISGS